MITFPNRLVLLCLLILPSAYVGAQQLKLGKNPTSIEKSALLDLNSDKQGLLLPRISDYTIAPLNTAPDGMIIYYVPDKLLYIRKNGVWNKLIDETSAISSVNGQTGPVVSLTTANISESVNLYYTDARARAAFSAGTGISLSGAGVISALNTSNLWNASQLQGRNIATTAPADQDVLTWSAATSTWLPKAVGSVTSVALSLPSSIFTVSGSPVTSTGTLSGTFNSQAANTVFAAPNGTAGTPSFRALVAADIPSGSGNYIQNISTGTQTASFSISGNGLIGTNLGVGISTTPANTLEVGGTTAASGLSGLRLTGLGAATLQSSMANTLAVNANGDVVVTQNAAANNWLITGNSNVSSSTHFLGTTNDVKMVIKSNNTSFLEFGRRATLGLVQNYPSYTDSDESVTLMKSALQFDVPSSVQFYKPKFYTTTDGNFRLKGSAAGTDFFELGSTGSNNGGGFEFIIGDDGDEPILFRSYYYADSSYTEMMRMQSKKVGINMAGVTPAQTLDVRGTMRLTGSTGTPDNILGRNSTSGDIATLGYDATTLSLTSGAIKANNTSSIWNANQLQSTAVAATAPTSGQYLVYDGTSWTPTTVSGSPGGSGTWSTTGNSGTTAGTNFIGTTDSKALVVKTNSTEVMRVDASSHVGIKTTTPTSTLHVNGSFATAVASYDNPSTAVTVNLDETYYMVARLSSNYGNIASVTANLPSAATCPGRIYVFSNTVTSSGSGKLYVKPSSSEFIGSLGNNTTMTLDERISAAIQSTGSYWVVLYKGSNQGY
ncbi:hypothetical protein [[Flexibacter] sp. ATCC 35208]|uniref:hypothetical protein n=1 Tax=[Flexibacter] sp. ATCC 35208 TaxID=1936242 RepID=UPI0009C61EBB|nr:hypothetical protein [[Flexibacter] sp. ATCC 35208]OMP75426.1 hypothetical protein BW716_30255 [[Flexibacter] sp. ATCC 35208]